MEFVDLLISLTSTLFGAAVGLIAGTVILVMATVCLWFWGQLALFLKAGVQNKLEDRRARRES